MNNFWDLHMRVFTQEPILLIVIILWGFWYMQYKQRAARQEKDPRSRHEHRKRILIGALTTLWGFIALPGITAGYEAQQMLLNNAGKGGSPVASGPKIAPLPDRIVVETVYDANDWFLASLLGALNRNADEKHQLVERFTGLKDAMSVIQIDLTTIRKQEQENHLAAMSTLDLMRCLPYAAHGYRFQRPLVSQFFQNFDWYHPKFDDAAEAETQFTPEERANIQMIANFERSRWTP